jgi:hypothetical protein
MREHRLQRLSIHFSLEFMPIFERNGLLRRPGVQPTSWLRCILRLEATLVDLADSRAR